MTILELKKFLVQFDDDRPVLIGSSTGERCYIPLRSTKITKEKDFKYSVWVDGEKWAHDEIMPYAIVIEGV